MKTNPQISVIVPIYNTAGYLERCLDSIRDQRMSDFEAILVDDGSTDNSLRIAEEYCKKDSRFRVFHKENGGSSSARNLALSHASGCWVTFIDSDDTVYDTYLSDLYEEAIASGADIVVSGIEYFYRGRKQARVYPDVRLRDDNLIEYFTKYKAHISANACEKLFRRSIVGNVRFKEGIHIHEDYLFCCECFLKINSISLTSKVNYLYEMREDSQSRWIYEPEREYMCCREVIDVHRRLIDRFGQDIKKDLSITKFVKEYLYSLCHSRQNFRQRIQAFSRLRYNAGDIYPEYSRPTFKDRIYLFAIAHKIYPLVFYITDIAIAKSNFKFVNQ